MRLAVQSGVATALARQSGRCGLERSATQLRCDVVHGARSLTSVASVCREANPEFCPGVAPIRRNARRDMRKVWSGETVKQSGVTQAKVRAVAPATRTSSYS